MEFSKVLEKYAQVWDWGFYGLWTESSFLLLCLNKEVFPGCGALGSAPAS